MVRSILARRRKARVRGIATQRFVPVRLVRAFMGERCAWREQCELRSQENE
jgi:hypothetical protein